MYTKIQNLEILINKYFNYLTEAESDYEKREIVGLYRTLFIIILVNTFDEIKRLLLQRSVMLMLCSMINKIKRRPKCYLTM